MKAKLNTLFAIIVLSPFMSLNAQIYEEPLMNGILFVPCAEMPDLMINYREDYKSLAIAYIIHSSPEYRERYKKLYNDYLKKLDKIDFEALPQECKVDYVLFKRDLNENIRLSDVASQEYNKVEKWFPFASKIFETEKLRRRGTKLDAQKLALELAAMNKQIKNLSLDLEKEKDFTLSNIHTGKQIVKDVKKALKSVYDFYNGYDPLFSWWIPIPYENLDETLDNYASKFEEKMSSPQFLQDGSGIAGKPVGKEELTKSLNYNYIPYSPEELIKIANIELDWSQKEILKASKDLGFGDDWKAASEKVKETYVAPGDQPEMIIRLFEESIKFIRDHDLLTIPPLAEEVWGIQMMSPERQLIAPFFLGGTSILVSYPTNTMEIEDRMMSMRGNNPHFSRATVHHESIAGHHLQGYMNNRNRAYRNFHTPFWLEGNALYWEFLLYDMKFPESPEDKIGMLFWRMHRSARIVFSLNYHLGNWTPQECIDFLVDRVNFERANATAEVRRSFASTYSPLYQLAYMVGGLQFWAMKKELVDNGNMSIKEFNDSVLQLNAMPVEMVRAILTNQDIKKDFKTKWKFYEKL